MISRWMKTVLVLSGGVLSAAMPAGYQAWNNQQINAVSKALVGKMTDGLASEKQGDWGNHQLLAAHRQKTGQSELHETQADILIIRGGSATFIIGGTIRGGKTSAPNEIRGEGIDGGTEVPVKAGDYLHIPVKTAHQFTLKPGQKVDYLAIKIDAK